MSGRPSSLLPCCFLNLVSRKQVFRKLSVLHAPLFFFIRVQQNNCLLLRTASNSRLEYMLLFLPAHISLKSQLKKKLNLCHISGKFSSNQVCSKLPEGDLCSVNSFFTHSHFDKTFCFKSLKLPHEVSSKKCSIRTGHLLIIVYF